MVSRAVKITEGGSRGGKGGGGGERRACARAVLTYARAASYIASSCNRKDTDLFLTGVLRTYASRTHAYISIYESPTKG